MTKTSGSPPPSAERLLAEVAEIARYLWERGWAERTTGSISADVSDLVKNTRDARGALLSFEGFLLPDLARHTLLLTVPTSRMRDLARSPGLHSGIIRINDSGSGYRIVWGDQKRLSPSPQVEMHLRMQQALTTQHAGQCVVLHAHPEGLLAMTQMAEFKDEGRLNSVLWGMQPQSMVTVPNGVGLVRYQRAGTTELIGAAVAALGRNSVILLEKHGCIAVGKTLNDAFDMIDTLEKSARVYFRVKSTGRTPEGLSDDQLQDLRLAFFGGSDKLS
jgi:rhamnulose-1-phosphate aldolase